MKIILPIIRKYHKFLVYFSIIGIICFSAHSIGTHISNKVKLAFINEVTNLYVPFVQSEAVEKLATHDVFQTWQAETSTQYFQNFYRTINISSLIVKANIYNSQAQLIWSSAPNVTYGAKEEETEVMEALSGNINSYDAGNGETAQKLGKKYLVGIHIPLFDASKHIVGAMEFYYDTTNIYQQIATVDKYLVGGVLLLIVIITVLLFISTRLEKQKIKNHAQILNEIIEHAPFGIYTVNNRGIIESFNPKMLKIVGMPSASMMIGMDSFKHPMQTEPQLNDFIKKGLEGSEFEQDFKVLNPRTKEAVWWRCHGIPIKNIITEKIDRLLIISEDINVKKQGELVQKEKSFAEQLISSSYSSIVVFDREGKIITWNAAISRITGVPKEKSIGKVFTELFHDTKDDITPKVKNLLEAGKYFDVEDSPYVIPTTGKIGVYEGHFNPITENGVITAGFGLIHDITLRKRTEELMSLQRDIAISISTSPDFSTVLVKILDQILKIPEVDSGGIYIKNPSDKTYSLSTSKGLMNAGFMKKMMEIPPQTPNYDHVIGGQLIFGNFRQMNIPDSEAKEEGILAVAILPVTYQNAVELIICLGSHTHEEFSQEVKKTLETVASQLTAVVAKQKVEEKIQLHTHELEELNKMMVGRELKMVQLKEELEKVKKSEK